VFILLGIRNQESNQSFYIIFIRNIYSEYLFGHPVEKVGAYIHIYRYVRYLYCTANGV